MKKKWMIWAGVVSLAVLGLAVLTSAYAYEGSMGWQGQKGGFGGYGDGAGPVFHGMSFGRHHQHGSDIAGSFFHRAGLYARKQDTLGLSGDQVKAIGDLKLQALKTVIKSKADLKIADLDIRAKLREDKIDTASIQTLIDQKSEIQKSLDKNMVDLTAKLQAVLNDKQLQTLKSLKKDHKDGWKHQGLSKEPSGPSAQDVNPENAA
jgi:Spy/CpxP family protein refolding chaperone